MSTVLAPTGGDGVLDHRLTIVDTVAEFGARLEAARVVDPGGPPPAPGVRVEREVRGQPGPGRGSGSRPARGPRR